MQETNLNPEILSFLSEYLRCPVNQLKLEKLKGDASERDYYRYQGKAGPSMIICIYHRSINWKEMPQFQIYQLFLKKGIPIAEVLRVEDKLGIIIFEDLGGANLQHELKKADQKLKEQLYKEAIDILLKIQTTAASALDSNTAASQLAFNEGKFLWELNFFYKHYILELLDKKVKEKEEQEIKAWFWEISAELAALPRTLCHRDYHSRNIMRQARRLYLIDYQDALQGPYSYDLASLLRDSYIKLPDKLVGQMIGYYLSKHPKLTKMKPEEFFRQFDLMSLQRNLKAIGTFSHQAVNKENDFYLQFIPSALGYIKTNLSKYGRFLRIKKIFSHYIDELN